MSEQLKPCPFCGGEKIYSRRDSTAYLAPHDNIILCDCGACGPNRATIDAAKEAWNTRAAQPEKEKEEK